MTEITFPKGTLALGTGSLLGRKSVRASTALVESALDNGIMHFDTARVYGRGESEALLGKILGNRSDVSITTKVGRGSATRSRSRALRGLARPALVTMKDAIGRIPHTPVRRPPAPVGNVNVDFLLASVETSRRALRRQTPIFHSMFGRAGATLEYFEAWLDGRMAETELVRHAARGLAGSPGVARALLGYAHAASPAATFVISSRSTDRIATNCADFSAGLTPEIADPFGTMVDRFRLETQGGRP